MHEEKNKQINKNKHKGNGKDVEAEMKHRFWLLHISCDEYISVVYNQIYEFSS